MIYESQPVLSYSVRHTLNLTVIVAVPGTGIRYRRSRPSRLSRLAANRQKKRVYLVFFNLPLSVRARHFRRDEREEKEKRKTAREDWGGALNNHCQSQDLSANPKNTQTCCADGESSPQLQIPRPHFQQRFPVGRPLM